METKISDGFPPKFAKEAVPHLAAPPLLAT